MMRQALFLALQSVRWYRWRTLTIVLSLSLALWLPITVRLLLLQFRTDITARANFTPLVVGAAGSRTDLVLHALYLDTPAPAATTMAEAEYIQQTGFATAIPLHIRYRTQSAGGAPGVPIVGTSLEYFDFRGLRVREGQMFSVLGECVLGAAAAHRLGLRPGDTILSAPRNVLSLAGDYPLRLSITGVLAATHSADDYVVFTDSKTAWVIDGIGHGHQNLTQATEDDLLLSRDSDSITASAAVLPYTEITPENIDSFHFHGEPGTFPLTAVIAIPESEKSRTLLLGRYGTERSLTQCLKPPEVVDDLLRIVFRAEQLVLISSLVMGVITVMLLTLVLSLSLRLREAEMQTMFRLGCSRATIGMLFGAEIVLMLTAATILALVAAWLTRLIAAESLRTLLF